MSFPFRFPFLRLGQWNHWYIEIICCTDSCYLFNFICCVSVCVHAHLWVCMHLWAEARCWCWVFSLIALLRLSFWDLGLMHCPLGWEVSECQGLPASSDPTSSTGVLAMCYCVWHFPGTWGFSTLTLTFVQPTEPSPQLLIVLVLRIDLSLV